MNQENKKTELPERLVVTENFSIGEHIGDVNSTTVRILLSPSDAYIPDKGVGLKEIVRALVDRYNRLVPRMRLWQMLHKIQRKRSQGGILYEFIAQREFDKNGGTETQKDFRAWMDDVQKRRPAPPRAEWYICNEKSEHFVKAVAELGEVVGKKTPVDPPRPKGMMKECG